MSGVDISLNQVLVIALCIAIFAFIYMISTGAMAATLANVNLTAVIG